MSSDKQAALRAEILLVHTQFAVAPDVQSDEASSPLPGFILAQTQK